MHPKTKPEPTVHLENWCRVRCSVSYTTSWTGLSTSLAATPTPAGLWKWRHLQGMHEHHIFHSPNAHQQKTYTMHIFPNISFFHNYLHLQQLQMKHKQQPQWPSFINKLKWTKHISCAASQTLIKQAHCQTQESILHIYICTYKTEYNLAHIISKCHSSEVSW